MFINNYYLLGGDIKKSLSPEIYQFLFKKYKLHYNYSAFSVEDKDFDNFFRYLLKIDNINGFNLTYPFKEKALKILCPEKRSPLMTGINTILKKENGIKCFNTDGQGFLRFLKRKKINNLNFLILGTGNTARSIAGTINEIEEAKIVFISRKDPINTDLNHYFPEKIKVDNYENVEKYKDYFLINATPLDIKLLKLKHIDFYDKIFDVNYNSKNTAYYNGIELLIEQALLNFKIWTGIDVDNDYDEVKKYLIGVN